MRRGLEKSFENQDGVYASLLEVELKDGSFDPKGYASKVPKGETLWQTIKSDLCNDFGYKNWFKITKIEPFFSVEDKEGLPRDRFLVYVFISDRFDTSEIRPLGLQCRWSKKDS